MKARELSNSVFSLGLPILLAAFMGFCDSASGQAEPAAPVQLISEPVELIPGRQSKWVGKTHLASGPCRLWITYGAGGITNEGYPGFPPAPYSPYSKGRGAARLRVQIGRREIAVVQCPPIPTEPGPPRKLVIPLVWPAKEKEEQEIRLAAIFGGEDDRLVIEKAALESTRPKPVPHPLLQPRPGWPAMDLISWCEFLFYTRPPGLSPEESRDRTLQPSWKAGFNMVWTVFNNPWGTVPFPWDEQATGTPMPASFAWSRDERWQVEGYRRYRGYLAERGMLELLYFPGALPGVPPEIRGPGQEASQIKTFDKILNSLLHDPWQLIDGISNERYCATNNSLTGSRELAVAHVNQMLESNPGAIAVNYISGVDSARPGMVGDFPNGLEPYSLGYFEGWDDALMYAPEPWWLRLNGGKKYRWIEFWTEDGEFVEEKDRAPIKEEAGGLPPPYSLYGGHIGEDYIVKQMNDACRLRLLDPARYDALTGVTWYTDGMFVSDTNREMVHAVSQDPVRAAVAGQLRSLGQGGKVRSLYPYSTNSDFLQNNCLALFLQEGKAGGDLFYDLQRSANFTPSSFSVSLCENFLGYAGPVAAERTKSAVLERGGYRAVLQSEVRLRSEKAPAMEILTYELISDTPYLTVTIENDVKEPGFALANVLSSGGFDEILVDGRPVREGGSLPVPEIAVLRDSSGLRPDTALLFLKAPAGSALEWQPGGALAVRRMSPQPLRIALAVPADLYTKEQLPLLAKHLSTPAPVLPWNAGPMKVANRSGLPVVEVVALRGADGRPYLVEEEGWWTFRGAQSSKRWQGTDLVKVYLQPAAEVAIQPWDFIRGVVRPGWGCQYLLAFLDVRTRSEGGSCRVKVLAETPLVFAPRIEFAWPVAEVALDGAPWHYFAGRHVFLPQNRGGEYEVEARPGKPRFPHLSRTFANVTSMEFSHDRLTVRAGAPPWRPKMPEGLRLTAQVEHPAHELGEIEGGRRIKGVRERSIIEIQPDTFTVHFRYFK
ncbi:MAG: hypothetical protein HY717_12585 [Planctomycetes bacterium]|nr:hypothetical protein [Planctomycetota bacterium]